MAYFRRHTYWHTQPIRRNGTRFFYTIDSTDRWSVATSVRLICGLPKGQLTLSYETYVLTTEVFSLIDGLVPLGRREIEGYNVTWKYEFYPTGVFWF